MITVKNKLDEKQLNIAETIAENCGISLKTASILFSRGIDTVEKAKVFLRPSKSHFIDPDLLSGMKEAVEKITEARDEGKTVVIYGDYDADGISATTVAYFALKEFGINAYTFIPEREEGYGLKVQNIDMLVEKYLPDLIITVDCGISAKAEVEYLLDLGVDVIVTDHHEIPDELPPCTVVNCKISNQEYGFDSLCGAGVIYKVAYALIGEKANKYLDVVALATIADSMPLTGENRDIVHEGLLLIENGTCHPAIKMLVEMSKLKQVKSTNVAFTIAPRINAAGRMGDARSALKLFLTDNPAEMWELCNLLNEYNVKRQEECEYLYKFAKEKLKLKGVNKRIIVLEDKSFKSGLVGIVAAKLVEEYNRPVILFVHTGDGIIKGSARSIECVNIFEAISCAKEMLTDFGGHAQAAGVAIRLEDIDKFEQKLEDYMQQHYNPQDFVSSTEVEEIVNEEFTLDFAKELDLLEPFGTGNKRPLFAIKGESLQASPIKFGSPHINIKTDYINLLYFNGESKFNILREPVEKTLVFECNVSTFMGVESHKGFIKEIEITAAADEKTKWISFRQNLLNIKQQKCDFTPLNLAQTKAKIAECLENPYETLFILTNPDNISKFEELKKFKINIYSPSDRSVINSLVTAFNGENCEDYKTIIYLDKPFNPIKPQNAKCFVNVETQGFNKTEIQADRSAVGRIYTKFKTEKPFIRSSIDALCFGGDCDNIEQFIFAVETLLEIGVFTTSGGTIRIDSSVKSDLNLSEIFRNFIQ